jgi:hypothetical protein
MRHIILLVSIFLSVAFSLHAQSQGILKGMVVDSVSGKPLPNCSVFFNSTSKGTVTQADGTFLIRDITPGKYQLIISDIGYETYVMDVSGSHLPVSLKINLRMKATELSSFVVEPFLKDGWSKYGQVFLQYFIGTTDNAGSCTIRNKDVLRFFFYKKSNRLKVTAAEPLIIENKALGYNLRYQLESFTLDYKENIVKYMGYPFFSEMPDKKGSHLKAWQENRKKVYLGSMLHFMRSLYSDRLQQEAFSLQLLVKKPNPEKQRVKAIYHPEKVVSDTMQVNREGSIKLNNDQQWPIDSLHYFWKVLKQPDFVLMMVQAERDSLVEVYPDGTRGLFFYGDLTVKYGKMDQGIAEHESAIRLLTPALIVFEANGTHYPPGEIFTLGSWALTETIANQLPYDYQLPDNIIAR